MRDDTFVRIAHALADPTRRLILREVRAAGDLTCSCIGGLSKLSQPTISHHIKILSQAGLLTVRRDGQCHLLTVNEPALASFAEALAPPAPPRKAQGRKTLRRMSRS